MFLLDWPHHLLLLQLTLHKSTAAASTWNQQNSVNASKKTEMIKVTSEKYLSKTAYAIKENLQTWFLES